MKGFFNKILRINLKTKTFKEETIPDLVYETYLGGKGFGTYLLMKEHPPGVDPFSPQNKLIFCTGPITNTRIYGSWRHGVFTKSPLTGLFSESYSGGKAAESMSRSMRKIASGRPAPRYGPSGAAFVSTIFTSIWMAGMT